MQKRSSNRDKLKKAKGKNCASLFLYALIVLVTLISALSFYSVLHGVGTDDAKLFVKPGVATITPLVPRAILPLHALQKDYNHIDIYNNKYFSQGGAHNSKSVASAFEERNSKRLQVAFAITITRDGKFQDGAAVMAYSIDRAFRDDNMDVSLVAFVHPNVTTSRPFLERVGYRVVETPTPVNVSAIRGRWLREHINDKAGCCGAAELIKLYAYRLVEFDWVVHLDADVLVFQSFAELLTQEGYSNRSLIYTTDPNMASYKGEEKLPVQGGFLVIKPSVADYQSLVSIVMEGHYKGSSAWGGTRIGWFWGGKTIQGLLAYYYQHVQDRGRGLRLDRCIYNTMADSDRCRATPIADIKTAHYTVCLKPWTCHQHGAGLCGKLHSRWHQARQEAEVFFNIQGGGPAAGESCPLGPRKRGRRYRPMDLEQARLPVNSTLLPPRPSSSLHVTPRLVESSSHSSRRWNDGPRVMHPLVGAGFVDIDEVEWSGQNS